MDVTLAAGLVVTFLIAFGSRRQQEIARRRRRFQARQVKPGGGG